MGFGLLSFVILVAIVLHRKLCDATPVLTLTPGTYNFKSGDKLELSCSVNELVDLSSVSFYQNNTQTIWINNLTTCSFFNLIPNDMRNYSIICDPSNTKFTMIKYGLNVSDDRAVWFCRMVSKSGGSCPISNTLCTSSISTLFWQDDTTTGRPDTATTVSTTNIEMRTTSIYTTTRSTEIGTTQSTDITTLCPLPVVVIVAITFSGILSILLIIIICCCCCPCCCLYHCRMEQNTDTNGKEFVETNGKGDAKNHTKTKVETQNPAYAMSNVQSTSSTYDTKEVQPTQSFNPTVNETCASDPVWEDKSDPNKNDIRESVQF